MKFVCDRCGKRYATAEDPGPGKVYKLKCKACGHLIVVKGQAGTSTGLPVITAAEIATATQAAEPATTPVPAAPPGIELHVEPEPDPAEPLPTPGPELAGEAPPEHVSDDAIEPLPGEAGEGPAPLPPEVAMAADAAAGSAPTPGAPQLELEDTATPSPAPLDQELTPPPPEKDELADFAAAAAEVMGTPLVAGEAHRPPVPGYRDIFGESGVIKPPEDSFTAAARASLPETWAGVSPAAPPPTPRPPPPSLAPHPSQKGGLGGMPIAIIGVGMLALLGITAWALIGRGGPAPSPFTEAPEPKPPAPNLAATQATPAPPAPAPAAERPSDPAPEPRVAEGKPEPRPEPRVAERPPEPRPRPAERRAERKAEPRVAERKPEPRPQPAPEPRVQELREEPREPELPDGATVLTQEVVSRVVGANRKAFGSCIATAGSTGLALDGRRVALRITINANGTVTYPTLDDQSLNTIELGQCLKSAARLMIFPRFKGDPFHYEVPLVLSSG